MKLGVSDQAERCIKYASSTRVLPRTGVSNVLPSPILSIGKKFVNATLENKFGQESAGSYVQLCFCHKKTGKPGQLRLL